MSLLVSVLYVLYFWKKMKFSVKDFSSKCDQIRSFLWIWSWLMRDDGGIRRAVSEGPKKPTET